MFENEVLVALVDISKAYPGVQALDRVSLELQSGEVHCLVGENGAGKSTLMRILSGAETPDDGEIHINGAVFSGLNPSQGIDLGIAMIYQETELVGPMTVAQNVFLGHEPVTGLGTVDRDSMNQKAEELLDRIGVRVPVKTLTRDLTAANRKLVQIAKAFSRDSRVLIMDEPGATLSDRELVKLFDVINELKRRGIGVIYISHRLNEVMEIGDRVTVLRQGKRISTSRVSDISVPDLIQDMVGRELTEHFEKTSSSKPGETVLSVRGLSYGRRVRNATFELRRGEVLGLAGLVGAGRSVLLHCIFGSLRPDSGEITVFGKPRTHQAPGAAIRKGLGLLPEERREEGLVLSLGVADNITMPIIDQLTSFLQFIKFKEFKEVAQEYVDQLKIVTTSLSQTVENLSGGNQQKVVVGKWLAADVRILLLDEPTRGIDVGAKREIYRLINELTSQGVSIIMASSELPEIIRMCDRILVMAEGEVTRTFREDEDVTQEAIMQHAVPRSAGIQGAAS